MQERFENWKRNNKTIRLSNEKAMASGELNPVMLDHNPLSDYTSAEIGVKIEGLGLSFHDLEDLEDNPSDDDESRDLSSLDTPLIAQNVDWSYATSPVHDQGACGSCWAFSGNTVLEATDYIMNTSDNPQKQSLSAQYPVSCGPYERHYLSGCV